MKKTISFFAVLLPGAISCAAQTQYDRVRLNANANVSQLDTTGAAVTAEHLLKFNLSRQIVEVTTADTSSGSANAARKPSMLTRFIYVSNTGGSDTNDGLSWGSAKKTLIAAYDALDSNGGTIYVAGDGVTVGGEVTNQGLWILGSATGEAHGADNLAASPKGAVRSSNTVTLTFTAHSTGTIAANGASRARFSAAINSATALIPGLQRSNNVVTVTTSVPHNVWTGASVTIRSARDTSFNGIFTVASVLGAYQYTYSQAAANAISGGGTSATTLVTLVLAAGLCYNIGEWITVSGVADSRFNGTFQLSGMPGGYCGTTVAYYQAGSAATSTGGTVVRGHAYAVGDSIHVFNVADSSFNGTFSVASVPSSTTLTFSQTGANASSGGGYTLPAGWRLAKTGIFSIECVGGYNNTANGPGINTCPITGGSQSDTTKPALWISSMAGIRLEGLALTAGAPIRLGVDSRNLRDVIGGNGGTVLVHMRNMSWTVSASSPTNGPGLDVGSNSFWYWIDHSICQANTAAASFSDAQACMRFMPSLSRVSGAGTNIFYVYVTNFQSNEGGIVMYTTGNSPWSLRVDNYTMESDGATRVGPAVWCRDCNSTGQAYLNFVGRSDTPLGSMPAIQIDPSTIQAPATANNFVLSNTWNDNPALQVIKGPATLAGGNKMTFVGNQPYLDRQFGLWGADGRVAGQHDGSRRSFPPSLVRFTNSAPQNPASWTISTGTPTLATGQTGPDGTTLNAVKVSTTSGSGSYRVSASFSSFAAHDWVIVGVWMQAANRTNGFYRASATGVVSMTNNGTFVNGSSLGLTVPSTGDGEWEWVVVADKISSPPVANSAVQLDLYADSTHPIVYYAPVIIKIAAGTISDTDALQLREALQTFPQRMTAGTIAMLPGQQLAISGAATQFLGTLAHSNTADRTYTFPDATGTLGLVLSGTTGSIGGSSLGAGACASGTVTILGATTSMTATASPVTDPGTGFTWMSFVSSTNHVTVRVCAIVAGTPTASNYHVRVIQ